MVQRLSFLGPVTDRPGPLLCSKVIIGQNTSRSLDVNS